jgi:hypothetical protein
VEQIPHEQLWYTRGFGSVTDPETPEVAIGTVFHKESILLLTSVELETPEMDDVVTIPAVNLMLQDSFLREATMVVGVKVISGQSVSLLDCDLISNTSIIFYYLPKPDMAKAAFAERPHHLPILIITNIGV